MGHVTRPATSVAIASDATSVHPPASVIGVSPEGLTIRVPSPRGTTRTLRVLANGEPASAATLVTDLPPRSGIFRCLAPRIGSTVHLERDDQLQAMPNPYLPKSGDRLVIAQTRSLDLDPPSVVIENKVGGDVTYAATGGVPRLLARVKQPVLGIGRYSGTERAGAGSVVGWTPTAVIVSTSAHRRRLDPQGMPVEEKGGFVIQPSEPALKGVTHTDSQMLIEGLPEGTVRPSVSTFFALPGVVSNGDPLDEQGMRVQVKIDGGPWEPIPDLRGAINAPNFAAGLEAALGGGRKVKAGITHFRLIFPQVSDVSFQRRVQLGTLPLAEPPQRGQSRISANIMGEGVVFVRFLLDGRVVSIRNVAPFTWDWDTTRSMNGEHLIEIQGMDGSFNTVTSVTVKVLVDN